jgi:hypothetical protein
MTKPRSLAAVLFEVLPIPFFARRNLYVERALQERRAAATALECIEANLLCLQADLDDMVGASEESRRTLSRMRQHISDLQALTRYDEVEMEHAGDEI